MGHLTRSERDALNQITTRRTLADLLDKFMNADAAKYSTECTALREAIITINVLDETLKDTLRTASYLRTQNSVLEFKVKEQQNQIENLTEGEIF